MVHVYTCTSTTYIQMNHFTRVDVYYSSTYKPFPPSIDVISVLPCGRRKPASRGVLYCNIVNTIPGGPRGRSTAYYQPPHQVRGAGVRIDGPHSECRGWSTCGSSRLRNVWAPTGVGRRQGPAPDTSCPARSNAGTRSYLILRLGAALWVSKSPCLDDG